MKWIVACATALFFSAVAGPGLAQTNTDGVTVLFERPQGRDREALAYERQLGNVAANAVSSEATREYLSVETDAARALTYQRNLGQSNTSGYDVRILRGANQIFGTPLYVSADAQARADRLRERLDPNNVGLTQTVPRDYFVQRTRTRDQEAFDIELLDREFRVTPPELNSSAMGEARLGALDGRGDARIFFYPTPETEGAQGSIVADVAVGADLIRILPPDEFGVSNVIRIEGANRLRDHPPPRADIRAAIMRAGEESRATPSTTPSPDHRCAATARTIDLGWFISPDAVPGLSVAENQRLRTEAPRQIQLAVDQLNTTLSRQLSSGVQVKAVGLFDTPVTWPNQRDLEDTVATLSNPASRATSTDVAKIRDRADAECIDIIVAVLNIPPLTISNGIPTQACGFAVSDAIPGHAVVAVNASCLSGFRQTLPHEIGHILGACHEFRTYSAGECESQRLPSHRLPGDRYAWTEADSRTSAAQRRQFAEACLIPPDNDPTPESDYMGEWVSSDVLTGFTRRPFFSQSGKCLGDPNAHMNAAVLVGARAQEVANYAARANAARPPDR